MTPYKLERIRVLLRAFACMQPTFTCISYSLSLNARQPGTLLDGLNALRSENFPKFSLKASFKLSKEFGEYF